MEIFIMKTIHYYISEKFLLFSIILKFEKLKKEKKKKKENKRSINLNRAYLNLM